LLSLFLLLLLSLLLEPPLIPVVVPDFILLDFILPDFILELVAPGPTLPSLDAPGAGCVCADAIAVAPKSEATTTAEIASFDRMRHLLLGLMMRESEPASRIWVPEPPPVFVRKL
jgi:hypothetical protein